MRGGPKACIRTEVQQAALANSQQKLYTGETKVSLPHTHSLPPLPFVYVNLENIPRAGRLKYFLQNWDFLTSDQWTLNTVKGYKLELTGAVTAAFPTSFECQSARPSRGRDCQPLRQESNTASSLP